MLLFAAIIDKLRDKLHPEKVASSGEDEEKKWRQYVFCLPLACYVCVYIGRVMLLQIKI